MTDWPPTFPPYLRVELVAKTLAILTHLRHHDIPAVILGGFVRDLALGRTPKDIDFFIDATSATVPKLITALDGYAWVRKVKPFPFQDTHFVLDIEVPNIAQEIQLIGFTGPITPEVMAGHADIGLCQGAFNTESFYAASAFEADLANRTLTLLRWDTNLADFRRGLTRLIKFAHRIGFTPVLPAELSADQQAEWQRAQQWAKLFQVNPPA